MTETKKDLSHYSVLICGLDPMCRSVVEKAIAMEQIIDVPYDLEKLSETKISPDPLILIFGSPPPGTRLMEVAQVARMQYPNQPIYYFTSNRGNFDRADFQKNGFTDAFLMPTDTELTIQILKDELSRSSKGVIRSFRPIQLVDLRPSELLDFDTFMFLPVNKKHIKMSAAGDELDPVQHEKLVKSGINSIHVTADQIQKFYTFTGKKLRNLQNGTGLSETERKERMTSAIRNLMASVFNDSSSEATMESGRNMIADCQEIVKSFITQGVDKNSWYSKVLQISGAESGTYNHSGNVATYGALFSLAVGVGKPEDVALAGLLHDMGVADLPHSVQAKTAGSRTPEEHEQYKKHVDHTLSLIRFRKMILPETVTKAIAQHHERWSGTGYPKGYAGSRISAEAQILALADEFDYLTSARDGLTRNTPSAAIRHLHRECADHPETARFDLALLEKFLAVFPEESS